MDTSQASPWVYLTPNPKSYWRQLFVKGTDFLARDLYVLYISPEDPMTAEEIAAAYGVPVEAVQEAISYCQSDPPEIRQDVEAQDAFLAAKGLGKTP
jgi:uncharacterized protein (DUF433 family)